MTIQEKIIFRTKTMANKKIIYPKGYGIKCIKMKKLINIHYVDNIDQAMKIVLPEAVEAL